MSMAQPQPAKTSTTLAEEGIVAGNLEVMLAETAQDIEEAQRLRYRIFAGELGAKFAEDIVREGRDHDAFDPYCDHLLVVEHDASGGYRIVGTYRLLRRSAMEKLGRFYTESEYNVDPLKKIPGEILELGRSCVDEAFRNRAVMQLLWRGIAAYLNKYRIPLMFGCASFAGVDPKEHAIPLSYLYHYHLSPPELRMTALPERYTDMNLLPKDQLDAKHAFAALPPLIKGYLRLGGYTGDGAVLDFECNTTDVGILVKTDLVTDKYVQRYAQGSVYKD